MKGKLTGGQWFGVMAIALVLITISVMVTVHFTRSAPEPTSPASPSPGQAALSDAFIEQQKPRVAQTVTKFYESWCGRDASYLDHPSSEYERVLRQRLQPYASERFLDRYVAVDIKLYKALRDYGREVLVKVVLGGGHISTEKYALVVVLLTVSTVNPDEKPVHTTSRATTNLVLNGDSRWVVDSVEGMSFDC